MPRREDLQSVLIIGSGPIVIGQACEFDYSGTQACKALREEGIRVVLLNSNPATIMTDPEMADRTYVEPITPEAIDRILALERRRGTPIDAILPTLGGQTALNCAARATDMGILEKHGVRLIGANRAAIHKAEDRTEFKNAMLHIGLDLPRSGVAHSWEQARAIVEEIGLPCVIRPAYTLGGTGGGIAWDMDGFETIVRRGLAYSLNSEVLIEESVLGWKEYELEVMRDRADNVVIICSIENFDPMGVHTGDSITVAPAQTLTDKEYQRMRDAAIRIIREIGVDTGGSNIQFAVDPATGRMVVIEMNPRVSRSSALASKATGYPIARIAAKLAIGYTLDELPNDITRKTPASFEPTIDYVVTKIPRFAFEKFPEADETLTTQMKSVGEAMSIGRTFKESLQKGIRSMEIKRFGLGLDANDMWLAARQRERRRQREEAEARARGGPVIRGWREGEPPADTREESAGQWPIPDEVLRSKLQKPSQGRLYYVRYAFKSGWSVEQVHELSRIDPWFLDQIQQLCEFEDELLRFAEEHAEGLAATVDYWSRLDSGAASPDHRASPADSPEEGKTSTENRPEKPEVVRRTEAAFRELVHKAKTWGYSDVQLGTAFGLPPHRIRAACRMLGIAPVYKLVDTCAAEFEAYTPYYYSSHENHPVRFGGDRLEIRLAGGGLMTIEGPVGTVEPDDEIRITDRPKVVILGGGPNRIGQGIEFDYCCVHALMAARNLGYETVMINSNPETVSTDYDTSDLLFFEPLTHEDVYNVCERLNGRPMGTAGGMLKGVIVQFGGQTPLNLAMGLKNAGVPILGTSPESIHLAEDREAFSRIIEQCGLRQPTNGIAYSAAEARQVARRIGYPVLVRPSYVLGGRAMQKCHLEEDLDRYMEQALQATDRAPLVDQAHPILIDQFLSEAIEVDVDCISDGSRVVVCGIMEHIEEAGIHSGDSACTLPPHSLSPALIASLKSQSEVLARTLNVRGLMNIQFAIRNEVIYVLEVNPRASRTVPFVSKATGVPWAKLATEVMLGKNLDQVMAEHGLTDAPWPRHISVKESVFPFNKFPGVDCVLGPEMRSTGEVMGIDENFGIAFAKAQMAAGGSLPLSGTILISVNDHDKALIAGPARELADMGFHLVATPRTRDTLHQAGIAADPVYKVPGEAGPYLVDMIREGKVNLLINTPIYWGSAAIEGHIRSAAVMHNVPLITTMAGVRAAVAAIRAMRQGDWSVRALQDYYQAAHGGKG